MNHGKKEKISMSLDSKTIDRMKWFRLRCKCGSNSETTELIYSIIAKVCHDEPSFVDYIIQHYNDVFKPNKRDGRKKNGRPKNVVEDNTVPSIPSPMS